MNVWRCSPHEMLDHHLGPSVVTLGVFDGVHLGHRHLIQAAVQGAEARNIASLLVTFDPHPAALFSPGQGPKQLTTLDQRLELFGSYGAGAVWVIPFSRDFSELSPHSFLEQLKSATGLVELHVGRAFRFGRDRQGDLKTMEDWGLQAGCEVHGHAFKAFDEKRLSSTRIRQTLSGGEVEVAGRLLGRPYQLSGIVVEGERRGRHLGFPTANLRWEQEQLPGNGVYITGVSGSHIQGVHLGLTNIGLKPTFGGPSITVETFLPEFRGDIYGSRMSLAFLHRLRGEQRFDSIDALREQIDCDVKAGCAWWAARALGASGNLGNWE